MELSNILIGPKMSNGKTLVVVTEVHPEINAWQIQYWMDLDDFLHEIL